jgi:hypothetical protein
MNGIPPPLLYALGYLFVLIAALVVVSLVLNRLSRDERRAERARRANRRQGPSEKSDVP